MVEALFPFNHPLVNKTRKSGLAGFYGVNGVLSFFFTATPLICT